MIKKIDTLLKNFLFNELEEPDSSELDFSFTLPNKEWSGNISQDMISIYLLDIKENLQLRNNEWKRSYTEDDKVQNTKPPVSMDLYYVISIYAKDGDVEEEHELFTHILTAFYNFFSLEKIYLSAESLELSKNIDMEMFPKIYMDDNLGFQFWSAIDQSAKPIICLKITANLELGVYLESALVKTKEISYSVLTQSLSRLSARVVFKSAEVTVPLNLALVELKDGDAKVIITTRSNALGLFNLEGISEVAESLEISLEGYLNKSILLEDIVNISSKQLNIELKKV